MNIGIICNPWLGGAGALPTELGKFLAQKKHKIHFFAFDVPFRLIGPWRENVYFHQTESLEYSAFNNPPDALTSASVISEVVYREKIQILNPHFAGPNSETAFLVKEILANKGYKLKVLNTLHGSDISVLGYNNLIKDSMQFLLKKSDAVMTVSGALAKEAENVYNIDNVETIYNFVDTSVFKPKSNKASELRKLFAKNDEKIVFHSSNFRSIKRVQDVLAIFHQINKKVPSKLMLVGEGPDQQIASKLAAKFKIIDRVHFMGFQSDMAKLLPMGDIFLLPSEKENFSLSALEAMACALPVIATNVGGMSEMIESGKDGYLFEVGDTSSMASAAIEILTDDIKYQEISSSAKKKVDENFTPEIIVPQYEKLYESVIKSHHS